MKNLLNRLSKQTKIFFAITFGGAWLAMLVAFFLGLRYGDTYFSWLTNIAMAMPAVGVLAVVKLSGEELNVNNTFVNPHFGRKTIFTYISSYFLPVFAVVLGAAFYFFLFTNQYDSTASTYVGSLMEQGLTFEESHTYLRGNILSAVLLGPLLSVFFSFFEEMGFRGYLLHKLAKLFGGESSDGTPAKKGAIKATVVTSALWAVWNIPMLALGFKYGLTYTGAPWLGMLVGVFVHFVLGLYLSYHAFKTGAVLAGALFRSGITALSILPMYFINTEFNLVVGPYIFGIVSSIALVLFALLALLRMARLQRSGKLMYVPPVKKERKRLKG